MKPGIGWPGRGAPSAAHLLPSRTILGALLGLYAALCEHAESETDPAENALWGAAASGFLWEHLLSWTTPYLDRFEGVGAPPYEAWACLLAEALHEEARRWGPPAVLPLHLRSAPGLPDPRRAGSDPFLSGILAPARSGMVLTRADLARASGDMGVGLRMGERRYALEAFFSQAPGETLDWLCGEAAAAARRHDDGPEDMALIAGFWSGRARAARDLLVSLRESDAPVIDRTEGVLQGSEVVDAGD